MSGPVVMGPIDMNLPKRDPTDHPPLLTMDYFGGPVIKNMELWTAVWQGDEALGQRVHNYSTWLVDNDEYWTTANGEYGVQRGKAMGWFVLPLAKPTTLDQSAMKTILQNFINTNNIPVNANTVIQFIVPEGTKQTMFGGQGCVQYLGYHTESTVNVTALGGNRTIPYAIDLQCGGGFDELMDTMSHEASEISTDPHPSSKPGYVAQGQPFGGENSDLCNPMSAHFRVPQILDGGQQVTFNYAGARDWSNANAMAGNADPCLPAPASHPYYNVAIDPPQLEGSVPSNPKGGDIYAKIEPYAFGNVGKIKWFVSLQGADGISIDPQQGENDAGDTVFVTIHLDPTVQAGDYPVLIFAEAAAGGENYWTSVLTLQ